MSRGMALGLWGVSALLATAAQAQAPNDAPLRSVLAQVAPRSVELEKASALLDDGDFEEAVKTLNRGLSQPDLTDDQLVEMYRLLGLAHLYLGNEEKARDALEKLLQARPEYEVPKSASPKVRALYARLKEDIKKRRVRPVTLSFEPVPEQRGGAPLVVEARIEELSLGAKARLFYRHAAGQSFSSVDFLRRKGSREDFVATVPAFELPQEALAYDVDYYVEVADAAQRRLAGRGDPFNPLTFTVSAKASELAPVEASRPWYKNPWVWVGIGAGVAAATTVGVVLATQRPTGTLPITIRIEGQP